MNKILVRLAEMEMQRAFILAVIVGAGFYFMVFDGGEEQDKRIQVLQGQLEEQERKVKESDAALKKLTDIRASIDSLHEQFRKASQQLPSDLKAAEIIRTVDTLARSAGVILKGTEPRQSIKEDIVEKFPLHVQLQGTYSEITLFLYYLSIMERITRVGSFTMENPATIDSKTKEGSLKFEGEILSYRYIAEANPMKGPGVPAPGAPAAGVAP